MQSLQAPSSVLMVRPHAFGFNEFTAESNAFQQRSELPASEIRSLAIREFDSMVQILRSKGVDVVVVEDLEEPVTPDAVFPNNWVAFLPDGKAFMFPMEAPVRRLERRRDIFDRVAESHLVAEVIDLSDAEIEGRYLEGTGSLVLDYINKIAYACRSSRTDETAFRRFCNIIGYEPVLFRAVDRSGLDIYHTNVMMAIGEKFAIICKESVAQEDRTKVLERLETTGHKIVDISYDQLESFAGNMMQLSNLHGQQFMLMSSAAYNSLRREQIAEIESYVEIIHVPIPTIEQLGGGSVRCMVAGIHLPFGNEN